MPLIKPSMVGHRFLQFASVFFSYETPDAHSGDTTLSVSQQDTEINPGNGSNHKAALPPWAVPVDMQTSKAEQV